MKKMIPYAFSVFASLILLSACPNPVQDPDRSSNADLSGLAVNAGTLSPAFSSGATSYTVSVSSSTESITVTGTKADPNATVSANNGVPQTLTPGENVILIQVTAQDGLTLKYYSVTVYRSNPSDASLSSLTINAGSLSPAFSPAITSYTVDVQNSIVNFKVTGTKADPNATVSANNGAFQVLNVGVNIITLTVTAQDGITTKDYVVSVTRAVSTNADLSALTVSEGILNPAFWRGTTTYSVCVSNATASIAVTGTKADAGASVSANNGEPIALNVGANPITIAVTAPDGVTVKNYVVTVTRLFSLPMVDVPAGKFQRDATPANISEITRPFKMSTYEITRSQFFDLMGVDPSDADNSTGTDDPVQRVNWYQAIAFCNKLSLAEGLSLVYEVAGVDFSSLSYESIPATGYDANWHKATANWDNDGYRLPTEMEWMWAAIGAPADGQGGSTNTTGYMKAFAGSNGGNVIDDYAWYGVNSGSKNHPVGTKLENELGLHDMSGNAQEWIWDNFAFPLPAGSLTDYRGKSVGTGNRVVRGGNFGSMASWCTVAYRHMFNEDYQGSTVGFRVVRY